MQIESRIPKLRDVSFDSALMWFSQMQSQGLLFHPDDDPATIERIADQVGVFSPPEVAEVRFVMSELFANLGDGVYEAAYPVVMNSYGLQLDS